MVMSIAGRADMVVSLISTSDVVDILSKVFVCKSMREVLGNFGTLVMVDLFTADAYVLVVTKKV